MELMYFRFLIQLCPTFTLINEITIGPNLYTSQIIPILTSYNTDAMNLLFFFLSANNLWMFCLLVACFIEFACTRAV